MSMSPSKMMMLEGRETILEVEVRGHEAILTSTPPEGEVITGDLTTDSIGEERTMSPVVGRMHLMGMGEILDTNVCKGASVICASTKELESFQPIIASPIIPIHTEQQEWSQGSTGSVSSGSGGYGNFLCTICDDRFDKKLLLNNHMKTSHGINYVFTDRGRKVKLIRIPENCNPGDGAELSNVPIGVNTSSLNVVTADPQPEPVEHETHTDVMNAVSTVARIEPDTPIVLPMLSIVTGATTTAEEQDESEGDGIGCGFFVKLDTQAYKKAVGKNQTPFAAFFPMNYFQKAFLLRIKEVGGSQLLEPATKKDVMRANFSNSKNYGENNNFNVAVVAFVRQVYNRESNSAAIIIDPPSDTLKKLKIMKYEQFTDFAFSFPVPQVEEGDENDEDAEAEILMDEQQEEDGENDCSVSENNLTLPAADISMPTLIAVSSPSRPGLTTPVKNAQTEPPIDDESLPPVLTPQIKTEEMETQELDKENINPAASVLASASPVVSRPICETPKRSMHNDEPLKLKKRKVKLEPIDFDSDDNDDVQGDITFAPTRSVGRPVKKRGRPRKLKFDDCL